MLLERNSFLFPLCGCEFSSSEHGGFDSNPPRVPRSAPSWGDHAIPILQMKKQTSKLCSSRSREAQNTPTILLI